MRKGIIWTIVCVLLVCCAYTHRRVIKALIKGEEMPKAPKWHFWVAKDKRRD
ncbi:MAG: hypothetical protein IJ225_08945 [Solobacterium sp.]|nr:hypothetical protein [Solobacterium sp.]